MMRHNYFLFFAVLFLLPALVSAAALININTADLTTLETLNGIGPSTGNAIITYRTNNGPFATIADIQNVSGIGPATYANIKDYITVSDTASSPAQTPQDPTPASTSTQTQTTHTQTAVSSVGNGPPPITAQITAESVTAAGAGTSFAGAAFGTQGEPLSGVRYIWNFGDGAMAEGANVLHTYLYPGEYDVALSVGYNYSSATARLVVTAVAPHMALVLEPDNSLLVVDETTQDLSIGDWSLTSGGKSFVIPQDTRVHAQGGVRFAPAILGFDAGRDSLLLFPNHKVAATSTLAKDSPLHGEQVSLSTAMSSPAAKASAQKAPALQPATIKAVNQTAAVATSPVSREVGWSYLVGLAAVIALGVVGTYYAYTKPSLAVTETVADEFDIE